MKRIVIIPDSFKGTLSSAQICDIVGEQFLRHTPDCEIIRIPVADGGEGSVDCFLAACGGESVEVEVSDPFFDKITVKYCLIDGGRTAVAELASAAGLSLAGDRKNPLITTSFGFGEILLDAASRGCDKIIAALGGSCTNDAGAGAAAACGVRFLDECGKAFIPTGGTLSRVRKIDTSALSDSLRGIEIVTMCDIDNPLYGEKGAAYVFAPQKGADSAGVALLDTGLASIAAVIRRDIGRDVSLLPGAGAAGGAGAGMSAFFGSTLRSGIDIVLDTVHFDSLARGADLIITGEGNLDSQSLGGKAVIGIARHAKKVGIPVIAVVGGVEPDLGEIYNAGVTAVFPINRRPEDLSVSSRFAEKNLAETAADIARLIASLAHRGHDKRSLDAE